MSFAVIPKFFKACEILLFGERLKIISVGKVLVFIFPILERWTALFAATSIWNGLTVTVQFSRSVVSYSLRPHESQHARPPCPSPTLRVYPNSCPLSRWCHPAISSSVVPFSSCPPIPPSKWVNSSHEVAKVLEFQLQHQSFQWTPRTDLL